MIVWFVVMIFSSVAFSQDIALQRPEPSKIMPILEELNLSEKQKQDIEEELMANLKRYDRVRKKYEKKIKKKEELEKEIEALRASMVEFNKNVVTIVRGFLNDEQKLMFSDILKKQKEKIKKEEKKEETPQPPQKAQDAAYTEKTSPFEIYFP